MNDDRAAPQDDSPTLGTSSVYRLFEAFIALREKNERQHKMFEQTLARTRDGLQDSFNNFAALTQKAYQQLRQELVGEKKFTLGLLNELLDLALDLEHIAGAKPVVPDDSALEGLRLWSDAVDVQNRKVQAALAKHGIHPYDAIVGAPYNPAHHERIGSRRVEGMDALRIAEQTQRGFASQQPDFILRRPKVIVSD